MNISWKSFLVGLTAGIALTLCGWIIHYHFYQLTHQRTFSTVVERSLGPVDIPSDTSAIIYNDMWDWHFSDLGGRAAKLSDYKGKVVFLHVWATWCGACREELPGIQTLYDSLKGNHISFLMISNEPQEKLLRFQRGSNYTFPLFQTEEIVPDAFPAPGIPATFILDKNGLLRLKEIGGALWNQPKTLKFLRQL